MLADEKFWRTRSQALLDNDEDDDDEDEHTRTGLKYLRSRRDNAHAPPRISWLLHLRFPSIPCRAVPTRGQKNARPLRVFRLPFKANIPTFRCRRDELTFVRLSQCLPAFLPAALNFKWHWLVMEDRGKYFNLRVCGSMPKV